MAETTVPQSVGQETSTEGTQVSEKPAWYSRLSEDWLATFLGLLLVILIVVRLFHAIP